MKIHCSFCRKDLGEKEPLADTRISHGVCITCYTHFSEQFKELRLTVSLDSFTKPVLILNQDGRILAANTQAAALTDNNSPSDLLGLLGGEAFECRFAHHPGGCWQTSNCATCTIRNLVESTMRTQLGQTHVRATIQGEKTELELTASTSYIDGVVRLVIESIRSIPLDRGKQ